MSTRLIQRVTIPVELYLVRGNVQQNASEFHRVFFEIVRAAARRVGDEAFDHAAAAIRVIAHADAENIVEALDAIRDARAASAPEAA